MSTGYLRSYIKDAVAYCKKHGLVKKLCLQNKKLAMTRATPNQNLHPPPFYNCLNLFGFLNLVHRPLELRNDKYSEKVFKYFVDYSDKESKKKVYTESQQHTSTEEKALMYMH